MFLSAIFSQKIATKLYIFNKKVTKLNLMYFFIKIYILKRFLKCFMNLTPGEME